MRLILFASFFLTTSLCNVIDEMLEWMAIEDPYELTSPAEKADMIVEDMFAQHPSLKPENEDDVVEIKKTFMAFSALQGKAREQVFEGTAKQYKQLSKMLKGLEKLSKKEFEGLSSAEKREIVNVRELVWHKLTSQGALKVIKKKEAEYKRLNMTKDQIKMDVMMKGLSTFHSWHKNMNPDEMFDHWKRTIDEL